jgi:hypothetical protein
VGIRAEATPSADLREAARVMSAARALFPIPNPSHAPVATAITFLTAPPDLHADRIAARVHAHRDRVTSSCTLRAAVMPTEATATSVGSPLATSLRKRSPGQEREPLRGDVRRVSRSTST